MYRFARIIALPLVTVFLAGCASGLSKQECEVANWHDIGFEDGANGRPEARISDHRKACAEHGVAPQLAEYRTGWQAGVETYCRPSNGYQLGRRGNRYGGVCPASLEPDFIAAYSDGRSLYTLQKDVNRLKRSLNTKRSRVKTIETEMRDTGIELVSSDIPTERRVVLVDNLRKLGVEHAETKAEIPALESELERKRQELETLASSQPY